MFFYYNTAYCARRPKETIFCQSTGAIYLGVEQISLENRCEVNQGALKDFFCRFDYIQLLRKFGNRGRSVDRIHTTLSNL